MHKTQLVSTSGRWLDLLAVAYGLDIEADGTHKYVDYNGLTFVAPLEQVA